MLSLDSSRTGRDVLWMISSHPPLAIPCRRLGSGSARVRCRVGTAPTQPTGPHAAQASWLGPCDTHAAWERTPQVAASLLWANLGKDKGSTQGALARLAPTKTTPSPRLPHQTVNPRQACCALQHLGKQMCRDPKGSYSHTDPRGGLI